jgi:hypothetical protein
MPILNIIPIKVNEAITFALLDPLYTKVTKIGVILINKMKILLLTNR